MKIFALLFLFASLSADCPFCNQNILDDQKIYEDDLCYVLATYKPILPHHILVIPKRHVDRFEDLSEEEMVRIYSVVKKTHQIFSQNFDSNDYLLLQKNGASAGQSVFHVHFHYIPRSGGSPSEILWGFFMDRFRGINRDKMHETIDLLKPYYQEM